LGLLSGIFPYIIYASPHDYLWVWWAFLLLGTCFAVFAWRFQIWLWRKEEKEKIGRNDEDVILDNFM
jgi:phosphotransferase system  glucose/maltose/N-acetylglucosamine-specific IIC component